MGLADVAKRYTPVENPEFGAKKKLVGDAVCELALEEIVGKKDGKKWIILRATAIHCVPDPKGRETTLEPGDEITIFYDPSNEEQAQKLMNDLFTAGVEYAKDGTDEEVFEAMQTASNGVLAYVRTWTKDKTQEQIDQAPDRASYWQNIKVLSKNKVTSENSTPQSPF